MFIAYYGQPLYIKKLLSQAVLVVVYHVQPHCND